MSHLAVRSDERRLLDVDPYVWWEPFQTTLEGAPTPAHYVSARLLDAAQHLAQPATRQAETLGARFADLARRWREETSFLSSSAARAVHPAYQQIIGMGPAALPLILCEMEDRGGHWFWALKAIAGVDPVAPEDRGRVEAMREAWLRWGREQGLRW
jgi:hypothetical protein